MAPRLAILKRLPTRGITSGKEVGRQRASHCRFLSQHACHYISDLPVVGRVEIFREVNTVAIMSFTLPTSTDEAIRRIAARSHPRPEGIANLLPMGPEARK